jgi:endonuclease-8
LPEGDTIWRTAAGLRSRILGKTVRSAQPASMKRLEGSAVTAVEPAGKHLLVSFDSGLVLHSHMRMTGSWHVYQPGERWRKPAHAAKVVLGFEDTQAVLFSAPVVELVRSASLPVAHLGPDILADPFELEEVLRRARAAGELPLGELLLEQRVCAGVGNVDEMLAKLFTTARRHMRENLASFDRRFGGHPGAVHGRKGRPCRRCGAAIRARAQGEQARITYYCARCQGVS